MATELMDRQLKTATAHWQRFNWFLQIAIGLVGLVVLLSVGYGFHMGGLLYQKYSPLMNATMKMRLEATTSYLWFEEWLGGDKTKDIQSIIKHLEHAEWYARAMVEGGERDDERLLPMGAEHLREKAMALESMLQDQRVLMNKRIVAIHMSGPGTPIDQIYHTELERFVAQAKLLESELKHLMSRKFEIFKFLSIGIITLCFLLFLVISYGFYRYENNRRKSYMKLLQMEDLLVQNEKMAALGSMIAGIAHEVNNPNNVIQFNMPILREYLSEIHPVLDEHSRMHPEFEVGHMPYPDFREDIGKLIDNVESGSNRVDQIVSLLKKFSKKKDNIRKEWIGIEEIVDRVLVITKAHVEKNVGAFNVDIPEDAPQVYCDPEIVEFLLINILNHAIDTLKTVPQSAIELNVCADMAARRLTIEVNDNERGVTDPDMDKIFDPFSSKGSSRGGAGVGLYLWRQLAGQMGASIRVFGKPGQGTTFSLVLHEVRDVRPAGEKQ